jgi:NAD(P) transhydrogenase subunit alpha
MTGALLSDITIFVLSLLVGFEVIGKVPATLHTPLMSAANSIHGIVLVGAMLIAAAADSAVGYLLAFVAAGFAALNVVGGYAVTERMLQMFRARPAVSKKDAEERAASEREGSQRERGATTADRTAATPAGPAEERA